MKFLPLLRITACMLLLLSSVVLAATADITGSCRVECEQRLVQCERYGDQQGQCSRQSRQCTEKCNPTSISKKRSRREARQAICTQRCDLNLSSCIGANPTGVEQCHAGQASCTARCK